MHIYDPCRDTTIKKITIYLTPEEAQELNGDLGILLKSPRNNHAHVNSRDYQKEISICIYRDEDIATFDEKSRRIIAYD